MSLSNFTQDRYSDLWKECGVFFAFTRAQFERGAKKDAQYVSLGSGMFCPSEHAKYVVDQLAIITKEGIEQDLQQNGKRKIIVRELHNYECFYVGCIDDCVEALKDYQIEREEILAVYREELPKVDL